MREYLETLYKLSYANKARAMDSIMDTLVHLQQDKMFDEWNQMLIDADLDRISSSCLHFLLKQSANYISVLPAYKDFYYKVRENFAKRGKDHERIANSLDRFADGGYHPYDPNAKPYVTPEARADNKLAARILKAQEDGDTELVEMLSTLQSYKIGSDDNEEEFRKLRRTYGSEEIRKMSIKALRDMAKMLEETGSGWPQIYYCKLPDDNLKKPLMNGVTVITSYPWGG